MSRRLFRVGALLAALVLLAGACADEDSGDDAGGDDGGGDSELICQVTDTNGVDDRSFNQTAYDGILRAEEELGTEARYLESTSETDFEPNIRQFLEQGCDLIVPVGFLLDSATQTAATENPDQKFAIVDCNISCSGGDDVEFENVKELTFATDEAAFLAGYAAAAATKTGKVGTFGGIQLPTVTIFMDGFLAGVQKYNADFGTDVQVAGWDGTTGLFTGDFDDQDKGKQTTKSLLDEGADIILPVAGEVGLGSIAALDEAGGEDLGLVWIDTDGCVSVPDACKYFLTSVEKRMDNAVFEAIQSVVDDEFEGGLYTGTIDNEGVGISDFQEWDDRVPQEVKDKIDEYRAAIADGTQSVEPS